MRVTQNTTANLIMNNLQVIRERQDQLQQQASSGLKISVPGDDPAVAQQILHLKSQSVVTEQYGRNIANATSQLALSDSALAGMGEVLVRAKEIAITMSNSTNLMAKNSAANELAQLKDQLIALGNTQFNGKYIFGGFKNDSPPFDATGGFNGTDDAIRIEVSRAASVQVNYSGGTLLRGGTPPGSTGTDIMQVFDDLATAVNAGDTSAAQAQLAGLEQGSSQILAGRSILGANSNRLTSAGLVNDDLKLTTTKVLADLQEVDFMQVVSDLSKQQTAFQTAIAASAKISQVSLLDYLK